MINIAYLSKHDQVRSKRPKKKHKQTKKKKVPTPMPDGEHKCYVCGKTKYLSIHHCYPGNNRDNSSIHGAVCWLCYNHHQGQEGVHSGNEELDQKIKKEFQLKLMNQGMSLDEFIRIFGRSYVGM